MEAVAEELKKRNPGFEGQVKHEVADGRVKKLEFLTDHVIDLSPVRALTRLEILYCEGSALGKGTLVDLSPLRGLRLTAMDLTDNPVVDL